MVTLQLERRTGSEDTLLSLIYNKPTLETKEIYPLLTKEGVVYKLEDVLLSDEQIERLSKLGLLEKKESKTFLACPTCGRLAISTSVVCPACKSQSLVKDEFLVHYECNYIGKVDEFSKEEDIYICPKCKKQLKRVGIDYGRPGKLYKCLKCNEVVQYPLILLTCAEEHTFKLDEADLREFPVYRVVSAKSITLIKEVVDSLATILRSLEDRLEVRTFEVLNYGEDLSYVAPLSIRDKINQKETLIDFILEGDNLEDKLMKALKTALHCDLNFVFVTKANIVDPEIFNPRRITLVKINKEDKNEIIARVMNVLFSKFI